MSRFMILVKFHIAVLQRDGGRERRGSVIVVVLVVVWIHLGSCFIMLFHGQMLLHLILSLSKVTSLHKETFTCASNKCTG